MITPRTALLCLLAFTLSAFATAGDVEQTVPFRYCMVDVPFPPYSTAGKTGHTNYLIAQAAKTAGLKLEWFEKPRKRCAAEVQQGRMDAMVSAYRPELEEIGVFPMSDGRIDENKAVLSARFLLVRRVGAPVEWDGQQFSGGTRGPVGVESSFLEVMDKLAHLGIRYDNGAKFLEPNLRKLQLGHVAAIILLDTEANRALLASFAGEFEILEPPFVTTAMYTVFSRAFQRHNPKQVQAYWQGVEDVRGSAAYRQYQLSHP